MDYSIIVPPIVAAIISALMSAVGVYVAITNRLTRIETQIATLAKSVEKHNGVVERTYKLEEKVRYLERTTGQLAEHTHNMEMEKRND